MPAKNLLRIDSEGSFHIYNKGVEQKTLFNDGEDYAIFLGYLQEYLTAPRDPKSVKKAFTVNGRTFHGTPHQPKNYYQDVELVGYSLMPDHFHIVIHQKVRGSLESFIRSLCTRYSIYFNKKYTRTGSLFQGPYKSVQVKDQSELTHLLAYLHLGANYSSYPEYIGKRDTSWIKPDSVLAGFEAGQAGYKAFQDSYEFNEAEKNILSGVILENENAHLERIHLTSEPTKKPVVEQQTSTVVNKPFIEPTISDSSRPNLTSLVVISIAGFVLLLTMGLGNIKLSEAYGFGLINPPAALAKFSGLYQTDQSEGNKVGQIASPEVAGETIEIAPVQESVQEPVMESASAEEVIEVEPTVPTEPPVIVKIDDGSLSVNIREQPTTNSQKIGQALDGDIFDVVSYSEGWYQVKLLDGGVGFITDEYLVESEEETNE